MEIERKFLVKQIPDLTGLDYHEIEQCYLNVSPVVRIRKKDSQYILTYKGKGLMAREELEADLNAESYFHLREKIDGNPITKRRYLIPYDKYTIEMDIFSGHMDGLVLAEVEFSSVQEAEDFVPPTWFGRDVTQDPRYHNSNMIFENPFEE